MPNPENIENHKFPKGKTGNPNGRPKKLPNLDALLAAELGEDTDQGKSNMRKILQGLLKAAAKGNHRAAEILLERAYGKVKQNLEVSGQQGGAIQINITSAAGDLGDT
jgi:hypothetical protein